MELDSLLKHFHIDVDWLVFDFGQDFIWDLRMGKASNRWHLSARENVAQMSSDRLSSTWSNRNVPFVFAVELIDFSFHLTGIRNEESGRGRTCHLRLVSLSWSARGKIWSKKNFICKSSIRISRETFCVDQWIGEVSILSDDCWVSFLFRSFDAKLVSVGQGIRSS